MEWSRSIFYWRQLDLILEALSIGKDGQPFIAWRATFRKVDFSSQSEIGPIWC